MPNASRRVRDGFKFVSNTVGITYILVQRKSKYPIIIFSLTVLAFFFPKIFTVK